MGPDASFTMQGSILLVGNRHGSGRDGSVDVDLAGARMGNPVDDTRSRRRGIIYAAAGAALFGTVFAAVYHAEVVAHRVGEPFGTLVLALP